MLLKDLQKEIDKLIRSKPESAHMDVYIIPDSRDRMAKAAYDIDLGTCTPYPARHVRGVIIQ